MQIGIHPALRRHDGGIYQYTVAFMEALDRHSASTATRWDHTFVVFAHDSDEPFLSRLAQPSREFRGTIRGDSRWTLRPFRPPSAPVSSVDLGGAGDVDHMLEQPEMHDWLLENQVELMLYPSPHRLSFEARIPFVMAIHDLQHRLHPEFPEVSADGEWERREYVFRNAARTATLLLAESTIGREDILDAYEPYGLEPDRVKVLPYAPDPPISPDLLEMRRQAVRSKYELPDRYLFYPAQFWPHKNHLRLIEALALLRRERGLTIPLVLTGSDSGAIRERVADEFRKTCIASGLDEHVRWLGYVSDEDKSGFYAGAEALVMPTFFGPTNLPFLEAWTLGCPVLTSRIRGIIEQVGDAALTVDPSSVPELAHGIAELWTDAALRARLVVAGVQKIREYTADDFRRTLAGFIDEAVARVSAEGSRFTERASTVS